MADGPRILIVEATFYPDVLALLVGGATAALDDAGASYERIQVPGAFEIPAVISLAAGAAAPFDGPPLDGPPLDGPPFDGYVALGCVIRGETSHYDYVCGESARALQDLACNRGLAIGYGILTVENRAQAIERAAPERRNKGGEVARVCLEMVLLKRRFPPAGH